MKGLSIFVLAASIALTKALHCPSTWNKLYRTYSRFDVCVKRLPVPVTWSQGETLCKDWIATPFELNETMTSNQIPFNFQEQEIWSSLLLRRGKFLYSGDPDTTIGVDAFPNVPWGVNQPDLSSGDCVSINPNSSVQFTACSRQLFMYCQKHLIRPLITEVPSYCPEGFVGNVNWGMCYKFVNESSTFKDAKKKCNDIGASLLSSTGELLDRSNSQSADYQIINAVNEYFYSKFTGNLDFVYWFESQSTGEMPTDIGSCGRLGWIDGVTVYQPTDTCDLQLPYMCQTPGKVAKDKKLAIEISVIEWTSDKLLHTACNLSRPLSAGETMHITINNRPIRRTFIGDNKGKLYLGNLDYVYPKININGVHRCLVIGLHKRQSWSKEIRFQYPETRSVFLQGSIGISDILPATDVLRFNLATEPEKQITVFSPTYNLQMSWSSMISNLREILPLSSVGFPQSDLYTRVTGFSGNGKTMTFDLMIQHYTQYTAEKEVLAISLLKDGIINQLSKLDRKRRKRATIAYYFDPSELNIRSTLVCGGLVYIPELETTVEFSPVPYGSNAESKETCITDKRPLVTAECHGALLTTTELRDITVNSKCLFNDLSESSVTDALRNITENLTSMEYDLLDHHKWSPYKAKWLRNLMTRINEANVQEVVDKVKNLTSDTNILTSFDVISVADILVEVSNLTQVDEKVVSQTIDIINDITNIQIDKLKRSQDEGSATNRLLEVVQHLSKTIALRGSSFKVLKENILMEIYDLNINSTSYVIGIQIQGDSQQALTNSIINNVLEGTDLNFDGIDAAIVLPEKLINKSRNATRVVLNIYKNWNLFSVRSDIKEYLPNSRVIAASLFIDGIPVQSLGDYEVVSLYRPREVSDQDVCGYWNYDIHDASGGWATDGCRLNKTDTGKYICVCDHLTNFAVLVNLGGQDTLSDSLAINIISWIGLIVSIGGLSLTILSFFLFKHLRKGRAQQTLFNLALSLLCFLIVFIVGIEQTQDYYGCITVAVLIHYFVLVSFMWMLMEGILQYLRFVKVLGTYIPHFILKTAIPAWGIPLIPVIIVLIYDYHLYNGGNKACWMSLTAFYYAFVIPVALIIVANMIVFVMIIKNLVGRPKGLQSNQSERKRAMMNFRAALSVFILLGLTWVFGFFTIEDASVVFQYIFVILNVFQGFLIFILFTAREKQVRQSWRKFCCKEKSKDKYKYATAMDHSKSRDNVYSNSSNTNSKSLTTGLTNGSNA